MMGAVYAYGVLSGRDKQSGRYIARYAGRTMPSQAAQPAAPPASAPAGEAASGGPYAPLMKAVAQGLKGEAAAHTRALLAGHEPLDLADHARIRARDAVGAGYEKGTRCLPQLLQSASAAQAAFEEIKAAVAKNGAPGASKGKIVLATVKGDVHDIGKNIVRVILEN